MLRSTRRLAFVVVASAVVFATGCSSNNTGKIVGKWKFTAATGVPDADQLQNLPGDAGKYLEFTADGRFLAYAVELGQRTDFGSARYSLGMGDTVNLTELNPPQDGKTKSRETVSINGDTMMLKGEGEKTMTLTRVKE